jgi:hypothetical protein
MQDNRLLPEQVHEEFEQYPPDPQAALKKAEEFFSSREKKGESWALYVAAEERARADKIARLRAARLAQQAQSAEAPQSKP